MNKINLKQIDYKLVIAGLIGIVLSLALVMLINGKLQVTNKPNIFTALKPTATPSSVDGTISLDKTVPSAIKVLITPSSTKVIASFSMRFTYMMDSSDYMPVSFTPEPTLIAAGWSFPIKKVTTDNGMATIDISAINTNPQGYSLAAPVTVGTIDFTGTPTNSTLTLDLDKSETKVIEKSANALNYQYQ